MLDAKRGNGHLPRLGGQNQIVLQRAILLAALDDFARLYIHVLVCRDVLNCELVHAAGLVYDNLVLLKRFLQGQEFLRGLIGAVNQKDGKVCMGVRPGNPVLGGTCRRG